MMYEELVKRLRSAESNYQETLDCLSEAADAIEKLCGLCASQSKDCSEAVAKYLELWAKQPRWIPVREQLIHSGWYLVACNEWGGSAVRKAIYDEATRKWLEFPCGGPKDITKFVTHWMPLPQPPKEE